jgi:hypothetical protein
MKTPFAIGRRDLFKKLAGAAGAVGLSALMPASAAASPRASAEASTPQTGAAHSAGSVSSATVRVILATGTAVEWTAVTSAGLTVGGQTNIAAGGVGLNTSIVNGAIASVMAAGGPHLSPKQVILLGGMI